MKLNNTLADLLAELQRVSGCQYLSDLHSSIYAQDVLYALHKINIEAYSLEDWSEAYRYIVGNRPGYSSRTVLVQDLIHSVETFL